MAEVTEEDSCAIPRWQSIKARLSNLNPEEFLAGTKVGDAVTLDVRRSDEITEGRLPNAVHIDYFALDLVDQLEALDRNLSYYVYCRSGRRSLRVCALMSNAGFKEVHNLEGGLISVSN